MANHGHVATKRHMTPEKVRAVIDRLNKDVFFGVLDIVDTDFTDGTVGWYITAEGAYGSRQCWLNSKRSFEMRHGGGSAFLWWVDSVIQDAISEEFDGRVTDDGGSGHDKVLRTWDTPLTFPEYFYAQNKRLTPFKIGMLKFLLPRDAYPKKYRLALKERGYNVPKQAKERQ